MLNLKTPLELSEKQKEIIDGFGILKVEDWEKNKTRLKRQFAKDLKKLQNDVCAYCGCKINGTGDVEHIAHKATNTEFMFTPKNLVYSCKTCNQTYKGTTEVVEKKDVDYEKCEFNIVHPYLDDVDSFFDTTKICIAIKDSLNSSDNKKANRTYDLFRWESTEVTERRATYFMAQKYAKERGTTISEIAIENILTYIP